ncbi:hypothetical protein HZH66_004498 [Vespula vulgaris]|uniref:Uncharacterized protein n=1 Tax=Vespula vulgaris TaxID=7454 RepID=A0A834KFE4_VESVU|nr:hypothetical protein HZH66_004498 [Vespula vulgaris]
MSTSMVLPLVPITRISQCAICESSRVPGGPFALWGYHNSPILQNQAGFHLPGISELMKLREKEDRNPLAREGILGVENGKDPMETFPNGISEV